MRNKIILFLSFLLLFTGCATLRPQKQVDVNQNKIVQEERKVDGTIAEIQKNEKNKKTETASLAIGIQHSLNQVSNPPVQVKTAQTLNERVVSIVGSPHIDEIKRIKATVDLLNSEVAEERKKGEELLNQRDEIINKLQKEKGELKEKYDDQLWKLTDKAKEVAKDADASKATLDQMSGMLGLNAVFWGLKKFVFSSLMFISIFFVVFIVLRVLSTANPIAASVFSIFNMIGSVAISTLKGLTPKAFEMSSLVSKAHFDKYKAPFMKIVDAIQELKEKSKDTNKPYSVEELLTKLDRSMDELEKDLIDGILKELKWRK